MALEVKNLKPITVQMLMYINYGRVNETVQRTTLRLTNKREVVKIGELNFMGSEVVDMKVRQTRSNFHALLGSGCSTSFNFNGAGEAKREENCTPVEG